MNQAVQEHNQLLLSAVVSNRVGIPPSSSPTSTPTEATTGSNTTIVVAVVVVVIVAMVLATAIIIVALRNRHSTVDLTKDSR